MSNAFQSVYNYKLIYVFRINDSAHEGCLKVGDATLLTSSAESAIVPNCKELNQAAKKRIDSYTKTAGISYELLHTELAVFYDKKGNKKAFRDYAVHNVLLNSNVKKVQFSSGGNEWFETDLQTVKNAINAVKNNQYTLTPNQVSNNRSPIIFRPEQSTAIDDTIKQFKKHDKMLWNAKMRFGKTLCALQVIKEMGFKSTLIATHRPDVKSGWHDDFDKIFYDSDQYTYVSKDDGPLAFNVAKSSNKPFVYFASIQDLRGSKEVGGKFDKNAEIFEYEWDCVVVDEAHEGTTTNLGKSVLTALTENKNKTPKQLSLSGTPFNILDNFEGNMFTWDYVMEQECKKKWDLEHFGDSNPYVTLPTLNIYTYDLGEILSSAYYEELEEKAFNFREFFRTWRGEKKKDGKEMPMDAEIGSFVHSDDVRRFLDLMTTKSDNNYPFSTDEYRGLFKHTLWMIPGVKEALALSAMLKDHPVFGSGQFEIVNVAGDGDEEEDNDKALNKVRNAIDNAQKTGKYTITLSCGKLTTGVTVPEWTAVFMLAGSSSTSAANYLQTIFRVQSPANIDGMIKENAYVFDFAPDRTLKMVAESVKISSKAGGTSGDDREVLKAFLNYCPIISISGSQMQAYNTDHMLQQLKRAYAERAVETGFEDDSIYKETFKLDAEQVSFFNDLKTIVGSSKQTKKVKEVKMAQQGFDDEEWEQQTLDGSKPKKDKKQISEAEKARREYEAKKRQERRNAISILRSISIRIPLLIYGAKTTNWNDNITIHDLPSIVDDSSWEEFMPAGITKDKFMEVIEFYDEDVFIAAGKKIRRIVKAADALDPVERIIKLSDLFSTFKNPDKETVLTPWKVVNLHLSKAIGGYCFYDGDYNMPIEEPRFVSHSGITEKVFNSTSKVLEINSKSGLYPLYVAYSIYRAKCDKIDEEELTLEKKRKIWDDTVSDSVFVICKTPMAVAITKRTLAGFRDIKVNAHYFDDLTNMLKNKPEQFKAKILKSNYWKQEGTMMKFNAVVGNPPYQENIEGRGEQPPLYHLFYDAAFSVSNIVSLITPARFLFDAGKTPSVWNQKMLNDEFFKIIEYYPSSKDVFTTVDIKGGVAISLRNAEKACGSIGVFIPDKTVRGIVDKVLPCSKEFISDIVYSNTSYKYSDYFFAENEGFAERVSGGSARYMSSSVFDKFPEAFFDEKPNDGEKYARIIGRRDNQRVELFFKEKYLVPPENYPKYKVYLASSNGSGILGEALSTPIVGQPFVGATETFVSFGSFETELEAKNLVKYIRTKFARLMLGTKKVTQGNKNAAVWSNVPLQDFSAKSDIDWTKSIFDIDRQLYAKYNLNDDEINFIEKTVKVMS